jgi:hypothetical protein
MDERTPPLQWPLAVVTAVHPGPDQRIHVVTMKTTKGGHSKDPLQKSVHYLRQIVHCNLLAGAASMFRRQDSLLCEFSSYGYFSKNGSVGTPSDCNTANKRI